MLETFTPAVCGSRKRQIVGQSLFAVSAVLAAAALGLLLGLVGSMLGAERAVLGAAALALVAAAREAGLIRFSIPQARRQVPEHWRFELPLPVWASGYGAGLGAGFFTYQPISTFWVACAGALALAKPVPAALCVSLYGAGRALMVIWPRRRADDPTAAVERLTSRRGTLLRANVVALVACGVLLAVAPTAGAGVTRIAQNAFDPTVDRGNIAFATAGGDVVVRPAGGGAITYPNATEPSLSGPFLAYRDAAGIRVVRWADGTEVRRIASPNVSKPALDWPRLAFVRRASPYDRLYVRNLTSSQGDALCDRPAADGSRPPVAPPRPAGLAHGHEAAVEDHGPHAGKRRAAHDGRDEDRAARQPVPLPHQGRLGGRPVRRHVPEAGLADQLAARRPGQDQEPHGQLLDDERGEQRGVHDALGDAHRARRRLSPHAVNSPSRSRNGDSPT